ncbi:MAG: hypothetical protein EXR98_07930 [Gemmataceae bacterium]|nr:hypothetical protein [Gemmataceae bacterium]
MQILRSIAAIVVGFIVSMIVIIAVKSVNGIVYAPPGDKPLMERISDLQNDKKAMKAWIESIPTPAMAILQVAWSLGTLLGGGLAALIASRARILHAGIIGGVVLLLTIVNLFMMKAECDYSHPDWLLITGLLLPLPTSLLAGKLVARWRRPAPAASENQP